MVRVAKQEDLKEILELYLYLHEKSVPEFSEHLMTTWNQIIQDENHHVIINEVDGKIISSCVCVIIPNLTRNVRPYALIENVVTHPEYRGRGYAEAVLNKLLSYKNVDCVVGETLRQSRGFWHKMIKKYNGTRRNVTYYDNTTSSFVIPNNSITNDEMYEMFDKWDKA